MGAAIFQQCERLTIPGSGTVQFQLKHNTPLDKLSIFAISGIRPLVDLAFQVTVNDQPFGDSVGISGTPASLPIYVSNGILNTNMIIPCTPPALKDVVDQYRFGVLITNNDAAPAQVTIYATGIQYTG